MTTSAAGLVANLNATLDVTTIPASAFAPITFSEFATGTRITDQYIDKGIIFGGDSPFISPDGANPTSPVLAGSPR